MSRELNTDLGVTGLTVTAQLYVQSTGVAYGAPIACTDIGNGWYAGDMAGVRGTYNVQFMAGGVMRAGGTIVWDGANEGIYQLTSTLTMLEAMRGFAATLLGTASGLNVGLPVYRDTANTKPVVSAVSDQAGNRQSVVLDLTP